MPDVSRARVLLGRELKGARTVAGLSQRALAELLGKSPVQVTLSRMENGTAIPDRTLAKRWLDACDAKPEVRERVAAFLDSAHNETNDWRDMLGDDSHLQGIARIRDEDAALIRNCEMSWMPGLLQTAEYTRQLAPHVDPLGRFDHAAMVADRVARQRILYGTGRRFEFLVAESALWWSPGEDVMAAQLDRLVTVSTLAAVKLAVLPMRRTGAASWHSFIYREAAEDGGLSVTTELVHGGGRITEPEMVDLYRALWERMWSAAAVGDDAVALIRKATPGT